MTGNVAVAERSSVNFCFLSAFDSDDNVRGFDDRIRLDAFFESQFLDRRIRDRRRYDDPRRDFDLDDAIHGAFFNRNDGSFNLIAC